LAQSDFADLNYNANSNAEHARIKYLNHFKDYLNRFKEKGTKVTIQSIRWANIERLQ
jgi:hypothetical protein